jgi:DNA-binding CsgD family transcriptional regulator
MGRPPPEPGTELTDPERRILDLVAEGLTNAQIARRSYLSVHTVKTHLARSIAKLAAANRLDAAVRSGAVAGRLTAEQHLDALTRLHVYGEPVADRLAALAKPCEVCRALAVIRGSLTESTERRAAP